MSAHGTRAIRLSLLVASTALALAVLLIPQSADSQVKALRLRNDTCLLRGFTSADDVVMTAVAIHSGGLGDVYQAICDADDCFGFSINRGAAANVLTTGLTAGDYDWFICAWNGQARRVVANLSGGAALYGPKSGSARAALELHAGDDRIVDLASDAAPAALARFVERLECTRAF